MFVIVFFSITNATDVLSPTLEFTRLLLIAQKSREISPQKILPRAYKTLMLDRNFHK